MRDISPLELSQKLNQQFPPTEHQAAVIGAPGTGAMLVVAGAGAGKTETMAARVVWLVANGYVRPEQVLGLTFTRKAAAELGKRIRSRLQTLARSSFMQDLPADDPRHEILKNISPAVSTYDAYAGDIVREYGLLAPVEPSARVITDAERWMITRDVLNEWREPLPGRNMGTMIKDIHQLSDELDNHLVDIHEAAEETRAAIDNLVNLDSSKKDKPEYFSGDNQKFLKAQEKRLAILPLVEACRRRLTELNVMTFGQQMSLAARVVENNTIVGEEQRRRFRVIMLDEYQDTGHAQRILLRNLFGNGLDEQLSVTAVGDPMQSIYMFRGATASNLEKFREDFPDAQGGPAQKLELTTSWRNPKGVLDLANVTSSWSMEDGGRTRLVSALQPRDGADEGDIHLAFFDEREQELEWLADNLERQWKDRAAAGHGAAERSFSAAVLVTKNRDAVPIYTKLVERGVPAEMTAGVGLLYIPEVADVFATLRVLVDPEDDVAMLRILTSPRWNIGAADIRALQRRAKQLHRHANAQGLGQHADNGTDDEEIPDELRHLPESLVQEVIHHVPDPTESGVCLADALADLGQATEFGMSQEGATRLTELAAELRELRQYSLPKSLVDLVTDVEQSLGVRTEVLTRWHSDRETSIGTSHLDHFADIVRSFSEVTSGNASDLVSYLLAARDEEGGLEPGEVQKKSDTVQILTIHKAKGLEWDIVAVPHAERANFGDAEKRPSVSTWVSQASRIPSSLRGDATPDPRMETMPVLLEENEGKNGQRTRAHHNKDVVQFKQAVGCFEAKERDRLFYVGITRTERVLYVSGAAYGPNDTGSDPSVAMTLLRNHLAAKHGVPTGEEGLGSFEQVPEIDHWSSLGGVVSASAIKAYEKEQVHSRETELMWPSDALNEYRKDYQERRKEGLLGPEPEGSVEELTWPRPASEKRINAAAFYEQVTRSPQESQGTDTGADTDQIRAWNSETDLLIEEFQQSARTTVSIPLDIRLTATEAVALKRDPEEFARRRRRPVPMEPQPYAKRGTAFHTWLENYYGTTSLLDEDQLPGAADATLNDPELEKLKEAFLRSEWKDRTPHAVEGAYSVTLAGHVYEGRIDAIFKDGEDPTTGWMVVDWKTGRKPTAENMAAAVTQLAVYRLAWAKVLSAQLGVTVDPENVRAAFHYVRTNETFEPEYLPTADELHEHLNFTSVLREK
ncbi:ATP-dependent helicase [Corynebacterium sp. 320]|uniref:ATP-dependent helicase n=1 Tax=Corynebacterium TaxID=1716 RepID=UPI00125CC200|nr:MULTISPECIES: UvrD-helicase domain-containing protein [Corynebacterium]KAB1504148.1 ATP-dependent helicase [Corynebacterium sp. 320]KAB1552752.1 ATP-dependent helicase [Corynebacterium sp. 321]KAB1554030.1 ATP-dependent helicase [Corynebacterium sp. 319]KAB3528284.1 ATP-dependent helicase [Corynebacterium sp. 250]KAB3540227.1 ATP-dependent helicase [Corynebacterium sp. 366]